MSNAIFNSIFGFIGSITKIVRDLIDSLSETHSMLILLGLSLGAGFWISRKYPKISENFIFIFYGIILFLLFNFV